MKARKRGDSWNISVYDYTDENGKKKYRSFTHQLKSECERMASEFVKERSLRKKTQEKSLDITVGECIDKYISLCETLSPTTVHAYERIRKYSFSAIMDKNVLSLTDTDMQDAINTECKRKSERTGVVISPKTVKNEWGLISAAISSVCKQTYKIRLPRLQRKADVLPEPEIIFAAIKDTVVELPCLLAMWCSLRMSETRGLRCTSVRDGKIYIEQVRVDVGTEPVLKKLAKTDDSIRDIQAPEYILDLIYKTSAWEDYKENGTDGFIVQMSRSEIYYHFTKIMKENGISNLSYHDLRHEFASISLNILGIPAKMVQLAGGWKGMDTINRFYSQGFDSVRKQSDKKRDEYFEKIKFGIEVDKMPEDAEK